MLDKIGKVWKIYLYAFDKSMIRSENTTRRLRPPPECIGRDYGNTVSHYNIKPAGPQA